MRKTRIQQGDKYYTPRGKELTRNHQTQTEAEFFSMLRSHIRNLSKIWVPKRVCLLRATRSYNGPNKRQKWEYQCAICNNYFKGTEVEVDHIIPCGSLNSFDDIGGFCERMLCEVEGLRVLCKPCHYNVTYGKEERG